MGTERRDEVETPLPKPVGTERRNEGETPLPGPIETEQRDREDTSLRSNVEVRNEIIVRLIIWLILGSAINVLPVLVAYFASASSISFASVLSSGDLLIATTAMLPPVLADLALNVKKARNSRVIIVVIGAFLALVSVVIYGFAHANAVSPGTFPHASGHLVELLSIAFFLTAVVIGGICAAIVAASGHEGISSKSETR